MTRALTLPDAIAIVRRRWLLGALPVVVAAPLAALIAVGLPPVYESTGRILVESQQIPEDLVRSTVTSGPAERIRLIEQRLTTRTRLLDAARRFEIFADQPDLSPTQIVDAMREAVTIRNIALATQGRGQITASAVEIAFRADNPVLAARVANDFVTRILAQNVEDRSARAADTLNFFTAEVERLGGALAAAEAEITAFKTGNDTALPDGQDFRRNEFSRIEDRMFERGTRITVLEEQLRLAVQGGGAPANVAQAELGRLRQLLVRQQSVYAETHPILRQTRAQIAALSDTAATLDDGAAGDDVPEQGVAATSGAGAIERQIAQLRQQNAEDAERLIALEAAMQRAPEVEVELSSLEREAESLRRQYEQTLQKQAEAALAERLEVNRQAERFELIERPEIPSRPISPNRPLIMAGGVIGAGALGAGLMLLVELLNRRIHSPRDLENAAGLRAMAVVGFVLTPAERLRRLWLRRAAVALLLVGAPLGLYLFDRNVTPLSVVATDLASLTGIDVWFATLESRLAD